MEQAAPHLDLILEDRSGEDWRDVVGYDGYYSVSTHGRIRSEPRLMKAKRGQGFFVSKSAILKQNRAGGQYHVGLSVDSIRTNRSVSTLVADAFLGERSPNQVVMHRNKVQSDNTLTNLEIVTKSESTKRSYAVGVMHSTLPLERDKYKLAQWGIFDAGQLIGRICTRCKVAKDLSDFYKDLLYCKACYGRQKGIAEAKIGTRRNRVHLRAAGLQACTLCQQVKPFDGFRVDKQRISGVVSVCKLCQRASEKAQRQASSRG